MPILYQPPLANPAPIGLYAAATIKEYPAPARLFDGVTVESRNCGPRWSMPIDCDAPVADPPPQGEQPRAEPMGFTGFVVGADDDCSLLVPEDEAQERAGQLLRLHESVLAEEETAPVLLDKAGAPQDVTGLVAAVGAIETAVAGSGFTGVLHADIHLLAPLQAAHLITRTGTQLLSPAGHRWAFGAGYGALGETIVATGPAVVHRAGVDFRHGENHQTNERLTVAFREVVVTWECWTTAVTVA